MADCTRVGTPDFSSADCMAERVHHGGQHAHVVGLGAFHAGRGAGDAAEDVAAADHDADLHAHARPRRRHRRRWRGPCRCRGHTRAGPSGPRRTASAGRADRPGGLACLAGPWRWRAPYRRRAGRTSSRVRLPGPASRRCPAWSLGAGRAAGSHRAAGLDAWCSDCPRSPHRPPASCGCRRTPAASHAR